MEQKKKRASLIATFLSGIFIIPIYFSCKPYSLTPIEVLLLLMFGCSFWGLMYLINKGPE